MSSTKAGVSSSSDSSRFSGEGTTEEDDEYIGPDPDQRYYGRPGEGILKGFKAPVKMGRLGEIKERNAKGGRKEDFFKDSLR